MISEQGVQTPCEICAQAIRFLSDCQSFVAAFGSLNAPTSTMSIRARTLAIHLHHVYSSANARFLPPSPQIEPERLSPTSVVAIGARTTPPPLCPFELERLPSASTMSIRAQTLVSHFHRVHSSPNARLHLSSSACHHLHHVYSGANACFPPPSPQIEPERSSPTSVMSIGAQTPPPPPCPFKLKRSPSASTMSI